MKTLTVKGKTTTYTFQDLTGTKKGKSLLDNYSKAKCKRLCQVYDNYSQAKVNAFDKCCEIKWQLNGDDEKITTYNSMQFSFAFTFETTDETTGEVIIYLAYITKDHRYIVN